jgi:hypothetical protein
MFRSGMNSRFRVQCKTRNIESVVKIFF